MTAADTPGREALTEAERCLDKLGDNPEALRDALRKCVSALRLAAKPSTDPADVWDAYCQEVPRDQRSPQGALAFGFAAAKPSDGKREATIEECAIACITPLTEEQRKQATEGFGALLSFETIWDMAQRTSCCAVRALASREEAMSDNERLMPLLDLPPAEQFDIAYKLAENVGYVLAPEPSYSAPPQSRDAAEGTGDDLPADAEHPINYRKAFAKLAPPKPAPDAMRRTICTTPPEDLLRLADAIEQARDAYLDAISRGPCGEVEKRALEQLLWNDKGTFGSALRVAALAAPVPPAEGAADFEIAGICTNSRCTTKPMLKRREGYDECPSCGKIYDRSFPRFIGSSSENGFPRVARCVFAADLSDEDHRKIAVALIFALSPSPAAPAEPDSLTLAREAIERKKDIEPNLAALAADLVVAGEAEVAAVAAEPVALPIETASKNHTWVRLLVDYSDEQIAFPLFDSAKPSWTIGYNGEDDTGEPGWTFMGWDWDQDCIVETNKGKVIGWLPFHAAPPVRGAESLALKIRDQVHAIQGTGLTKQSIDAIAGILSLPVQSSDGEREWHDISTAPKDQEVEVRGIWKLRGDGIQFTHWRALSRQLPHEPVSLHSTITIRPGYEKVACGNCNGSGRVRKRANSYYGWKEDRRKKPRCQDCGGYGFNVVRSATTDASTKGDGK
jgi:hypothetical protein